MSKPAAAHIPLSARIISANLEAVEQITAEFPSLDILFLESGGDNLAAFFSPELVDAAIYVIDVAGGDKIPRKGGPGITRSDLLIINKIDLAEYVGADLTVMARDTKRMRGEKPAAFTDLRKSEGLQMSSLGYNGNCYLKKMRNPANWIS